MGSSKERGELFGIPYDFRRPTLRRLVSAYWKPGEKMLVKKPFGVGYTLNLANWRSWVILGVTAAMLALEGRKKADASTDESEEGPVEVIVED